MAEEKVTEAKIIDVEVSETSKPAETPEVKKPLKDRISPAWSMGFFVLSVLLAAFGAMKGSYMAFAAGFITLFFMRGEEFKFGIKGLGKEVYGSVKTSIAFTRNLIGSFIHK